MISFRATSSGSNFSSDSTNGLLPCLSCLDLLETKLIKVLGSLTICWASFRNSSLTAVLCMVFNLRIWLNEKFYVTDGNRYYDGMHYFL